jgi:hypothetical protein
MDLAREWSHYECGALLLSAATGEAFTPLVPQRLSSLVRMGVLPVSCVGAWIAFRMWV